tara:strand:- start:352 stop:525 length:174 start_codon:yes stop_codon:yes gene_type:complete
MRLFDFPIFFIIYFGPLIFVIFDKKTSGREKLGWFLLTLIFGLLSIPFYLIKTKKSD